MQRPCTQKFYGAANAERGGPSVALHAVAPRGRRWLHRTHEVSGRAGDEREAHSIPSEIDSGGGGSAAAAGGQNEIVTQPPEIKLGRADADGPTEGAEGAQGMSRSARRAGSGSRQQGTNRRTNGERLCRSIDRTGRIKGKASSGLTPMALWGAKLVSERRGKTIPCSE